ncbi:MAG TPA: COX15/CtaA family protein [Gemmatimonadales bacterium]|nr:COX15/CtaA family protein [Gemmatimonadales bacterium]
MSTASIRYAGSSVTSSHTDSPAHGSTGRAVGVWLALFAVVIFAIILVGGATRLTESGLSITEWKPVTGIFPPVTEAQWLVEFEKYKQIPQYLELNAGMSLDSFKVIYLWEFWHRVIARLAGFVFLIPLAWFASRRRIPSFVTLRVYLIGVFLLVQAAMGWWMVTSGLSGRTEVSQYRLATHLTFAFLILALTVWTSADVLAGRRLRTSTLQGWRSRALPAMLGLVFLTSASGALVAGLRAGKIYNSFPLMAGRVAPAEYGMLSPWWLNLFENPAAVQFNHRVLAVVTFSAAVGLWMLLRRTGHARLTRCMHLVACVALLQLSLGVATLLLSVPVALGVAHQGGAALLLVAVVLAWHASGDTEVNVAPGRLTSGD